MSNRMKIPKVCQHCGKTFIAQTTVTQFCGDTCAKRNYKKRKKDEKIQAALIETKDQILATTAMGSNNTFGKEYLCVNEVSDLLGVSRWTIQRMIQKGQINMTSIGRKKLMPKSQLENLFNQ